MREGMRDMREGMRHRWSDPIPYGAYNTTRTDTDSDTDTAGPFNRCCRGWGIREREPLPLVPQAIVVLQRCRCRCRRRGRGRRSRW